MELLFSWEEKRSEREVGKEVFQINPVLNWFPNNIYAMFKMLL